MKKYTLETVKKFFEDENCVLLENEYKDYHHSMKYKCSCGNESKIKLANFMNGQRCLKCGFEKVANAKKNKLSDVQNFFNEHGCELLETEYKNNNTKMKFRCHCGNIDFKALSKFRTTSHCTECTNKIKKENLEKIRKEYEEIAKETLKEEGYILLGEYKRAASPVLMRCNKGHQIKMTLANFKTGYRCAECVNKKKKTIEEVKENFEKDGFALISTEYKGAFKKLDCICPKGHEIQISWDNFRAGLFIP